MKKLKFLLFFMLTLMFSSCEEGDTPYCIPNTCNARLPFCGEITFGEDNCGNPCQLPGVECPVPPVPPSPPPDPDVCQEPSETINCWGINGQIKFFNTRMEAENFIKTLPKCDYREVHQLFKQVMVQYWTRYCSPK